MDKKVFFNTTLDPELLKQVKILAIKQDKRINELIAEALADLLKKYSDNPPAMPEE